MPTFVSTLCICIVFVPMFLLTGVARYLFVPMARRSCSPCSPRTSSRARWCRRWPSTCCAQVTSTMRSRPLEPVRPRSTPASRRGFSRMRDWLSRPPGAVPGCADAVHGAVARGLRRCRRRCSRSSAATSSRPWMPARSSCTCAPRPARASRRPRASATRSRPGSAALHSRRGAGDHPRQHRPAAQRHQSVLQQLGHGRPGRRRHHRLADARAIARPRSTSASCARSCRRISPASPSTSCRPTSSARS